MPDSIGNSFRIVGIVGINNGVIIKDLSDPAISDINFKGQWILDTDGPLYLDFIANNTDKVRITGICSCSSETGSNIDLTISQQKALKTAIAEYIKLIAPNRS